MHRGDPNTDFLTSCLRLLAQSVRFIAFGDVEVIMSVAL